MLNIATVISLIKQYGGADPAVIESAVQDWLEAHPEATTTVQDGSITEQKLATSIAQKLGLISSLSDEIDDIGSDVTDLKSALILLPSEIANASDSVASEIISGSYSSLDVDLEYLPFMKINSIGNNCTNVHVEGYNLLNTDVELGAPDDTYQAATTKRKWTTGTYIKGISVTNIYTPNNITSINKIGDGEVDYNCWNASYGIYFVVELTPGETYTFSGSYGANYQKGSASQIFYASDGSYLSYNNTVQFTVPNNAKWTLVGYNGGTNDNTKNRVNFIDITLVKGQTAKDYTPYHSADIEPVAGNYIPVQKYDTITFQGGGDVAVTLEAYHNIHQKYWKKRVFVLGDSISDNNHHYSGIPMWNKWPYVLEEKNGFYLTNDSISGSGFIANPQNQTNKNFITRVSDHNSEDFDLIIIFGGVNDYLQRVTQSIELGSPETIDTEDPSANFYSAVDYVIRTLINYHVEARLVGLLPLPIASSYSRKDDFVLALIERYEHYNIPYLDLRNQGGYRPFITEFMNEFTELTGNPPVHDGVHPNQKWDNNYLAPMIDEFINRFI